MTILPKHSAIRVPKGSRSSYPNPTPREFPRRRFLAHA